ncbi:hypothetical protein F5B20DRAFT_545667 [Whalleya microplaca]|nr:hypothetical protein F5B20DRAFT_545667 [Whalleya microplaca]
MKVFYAFGFIYLAAGAAVPQHNHTSSRALYFLENNPAGSNIVSVKISSKDGTLSDPVRTSTKGAGLVGLNNLGEATVDTLFSQDSVVVSGSNLLTVNPGSNSVSLFTIPRHDPQHPKLIGAPVPSGGDFPNTIAHLPRHNLTCVANSGAKSSVQCYTVTASGLVPRGAPMPLPLANQTTPPMGPANTASDILFNPSGSALFVSIKGTGAARQPGYLYAYAVSANGTVDPTPRVSRPAALGLDFSVSFLGRDDRAYVTDPGFGGAFVDIGCDLSVRVARVVNVTGNSAACWSQYSAEFGAVYSLDAGVADITVLDPVSMDIKGTIAGPAAQGGKFDSVVAGEFLYTLDGVASITTYSLKEERVVQTLNLTDFGARQFFQGMAFYDGSSW